MYLGAEEIAAVDYVKVLSQHLSSVAYPGILFGWGSTNSVEDTG
jgi:hypothetical protein